nr:hypothetical protein CFP56_25994 [Quercus suber]
MCGGTHAAFMCRQGSHLLVHSRMLMVRDPRLFIHEECGKRMDSSRQGLCLVGVADGLEPRGRQLQKKSGLEGFRHAPNRCIARPHGPHGSSAGPHHPGSLSPHVPISDRIPAVRSPQPTSRNICNLQASRAVSRSQRNESYFVYSSPSAKTLHFVCSHEVTRMRRRPEAVPHRPFRNGMTKTLMPTSLQNIWLKTDTSWRPTSHGNNYALVWRRTQHICLHMHKAHGRIRREKHRVTACRGQWLRHESELTNAAAVSSICHSRLIQGSRAQAQRTGTQADDLDIINFIVWLPVQDRVLVFNVGG